MAKSKNVISVTLCADQREIDVLRNRNNSDEEIQNLYEEYIDSSCGCTFLCWYNENIENLDEDEMNDEDRDNENHF